MTHPILALLLIAQQTAPAPGGDLTRMLNGTPPAIVQPRAVAPAARPAASTPAASAPATPAPIKTPPVASPPVASAAPANSGVVAGTAPPTSAPTEPPPPVLTVLDASAMAALPFAVELPPGFAVTTGRPAPDFKVYTIRRGGQPFVMIYAGPASQFPIYSGEMVEVGGRASVVATEEGRRVALEHLFTRATAPREVHVWIASLEGADRALAERIGQSVDLR